MIIDRRRSSSSTPSVPYSHARCVRTRGGGIFSGGGLAIMPTQSGIMPGNIVLVSTTLLLFAAKLLLSPTAAQGNSYTLGKI